MLIVLMEVEKKMTKIVQYIEIFNRQIKQILLNN